MSDSEAPDPGEAVLQPPAFPKKMLIFTILCVIAVTLAFVFISDLEDWVGQGMDVVMVVTVVLSLLLILLWLGWFLALSRWPWKWRLFASAVLISIPVVYIKVFRPVLGGDVTIVGHDPLWNRHTDVAPVDESTLPSAANGVDLLTETPGDFPRFLGPNQNAEVTTGISLDTVRFAESERLWVQPIGYGWSGFAARNGFAVTMEQREDQECVTCYAVASGNMEWIYQHTTRHQDPGNLGRVGPRSTPTIHKGNVYAVGAVGDFVCLDGADGAVIWQVDLNDVLGLQVASDVDRDGNTIHYEKNSSLAWGRAGSPLIVDDLVVIPGGGPDGGPYATLLAFDQATGEIRWKSGKEMIAYGSPVLATVAGSQQILLVAESKAMGFAAATGKKLWDFPRPGDSDGGANTSQLTVVSASQVLTSKGYPDGGGELIELTNEDGEIHARSVWNNTRVLKTKLMSPVVYDGHAYSLSNGFLECARLADGERIWKRRGRFGHGQLLLVDDTILLHSESGTLYLIQATPDGYHELGSFPTIEGVCWNTLCLTGDTILVRSEIEAACFRLATVAN